MGIGKKTCRPKTEQKLLTKYLLYDPILKIQISSCSRDRICRFPACSFSV
jgi:hypothetical protein